MHASRQPADRAVLITEAPVNVDAEFEHRRRRYLLMMTLRALCVIGAASTFHLSGWLAAAFVVAAAVLPWMAVLIANDRPPKKEVQFRRFVSHPEESPAVPALTPARPVGDAADTGAPFEHHTVIDI